MASRSYANLLDLGGGFLDSPRTPRTIPRTMTVPGVISDLDASGRCDEDSDVSSSDYRERKIIVANMLPLQAKRDIETGKWCFNLDKDSILLQLKDGFSSDTEVLYVGSLKAEWCSSRFSFFRTIMSIKAKTIFRDRLAQLILDLKATFKLKIKTRAFKKSQKQFVNFYFYTT